MNNTDNASRVVINLDGAFDDIDDDDITLPNMPVQSVPIIDDSEAAVQQNNPQKTNSHEILTPKANEVALGTPIVSSENIVLADTSSTPTISSTDIPPNPAPNPTTIPKMPLQAQLGDGSAATSASAVTAKSISVAPSAVAQQQKTAEHSTQKKPEQQPQQPVEEKHGDNQQNNQKGSWFNRMKSGLSKSRKNLAEGMVSILIGGKEIDDELLEEVEDQLLVADIGVNATNRIIKSLTEQTARGDLIYAHSLYKALQNELVDILTPKVAPLVIDTSKKPFVILVVGVNGVGKTTTIGKLAKRLQGEGKSVMLAAGDTFRAAATEQLQIWGERNNIPVVAQGHGSDSASVIFDAMQSAKAKNIDVLIADTAGRLQNKTHLMAELEKVVRVMQKADPSAPHEGMIVLDAGTGQNAINQVELFNKVVPLTGITITKLDGTAKGGVVFNIAETTDVPIRYIGVGESIDDLRAFSPKQFVAALFETDDKE